MLYSDKKACESQACWRVRFAIVLCNVSTSGAQNCGALLNQHQALKEKHRPHKASELVLPSRHVEDHGGQFGTLNVSGEFHVPIGWQLQKLMIVSYDGNRPVLVR
jgi:hypothetical protein